MILALVLLALWVWTRRWPWLVLMFVAMASVAASHDPILFAHNPLVPGLCFMVASYYRGGTSTNLGWVLMALGLVGVTLGLMRTLS